MLDTDRKNANIFLYVRPKKSEKPPKGWLPQSSKVNQERRNATQKTTQDGEKEVPWTSVTRGHRGRKAAMQANQMTGDIQQKELYRKFPTNYLVDLLV